MKFCPTCQQTYENSPALFCLNDGTKLAEAAAPTAPQQQQPPVNQPPQAVQPPPFNQPNVAANQPPVYQPQQQQQPQTAAPPVPASLLVTFFADHFVAPAGMLSHKTTVPCQHHVKVNSQDLAKAAVVAAFWELRNQRLIDLHLGKAKGFIFSSTTVEVRFLRDGAAGGLECDFLEILHATRGETTAENVVFRFLHHETEHPFATVLSRLTDWAVRLGYGHAQEKHGFFNHGELDFAPDCQRIGGLRGASENLHHRWEEFTQHEHALYEALLHECQEALTHRAAHH